MNPQVTHGTQLPQPPTDGITAMRFAANSDLLLVSSWDGVRFLALWLRDVLARLTVVTWHVRRRLMLGCGTTP